MKKDFSLLEQFRKKPILGMMNVSSKFLLESLLPSLCVSCRTQLGQGGWLCAECWKELSFTLKPFCRFCGYMLPSSMAADAICAPCARQRPQFDSAFAPLLYKSLGRDLIAGFKYRGQRYLAPFFARLLWQAAPSVISRADRIVVVPLHWQKWLHRGYNQAGLLGRYLAHLSGKPLSLSALKRVRATPMQRLLNPRQRRLNVKNAFRVRGAEKFKKEKILLIDDVLTTGATVSECSNVLRKAGAARVDVLTLARVDLPRSPRR